ncbi:hypothetical protein BH20ACT8_BH20ACT8_09840 [soil metagenome]
MDHRPTELGVEQLGQGADPWRFGLVFHAPQATEVTLRLDGSGEPRIRALDQSYGLTARPHGPAGERRISGDHSDVVLVGRTLTP